MPQTDIILLERVKNLGEMGAVVRVKPGYARNYLLPQGKALRATAANRERYEAEKEAREAANLADRKNAEAVAGRMKNLHVVLVRAASESGQLYGSASSRDIAAAITAAGFAITRNQVDMERAIKTLGLFPTRIAIHPEVTAEVTINVARSKDEAAKQKQLGRAIVGDEEEEEIRRTRKKKAKKSRSRRPGAAQPGDKAKSAEAKTDTPAAKAKPKPKADAAAKTKPAPKAKAAVAKKPAEKKPAAKKAGKGFMARLLGR